MAFCTFFLLAGIFSRLSREGSHPYILDHSPHSAQSSESWVVVVRSGQATLEMVSVRPQTQGRSHCDSYSLLNYLAMPSLSYKCPSITLPPSFSFQLLSSDATLCSLPSAGRAEFRLLPWFWNLNQTLTWLHIITQMEMVPIPVLSLISITSIIQQCH